MLNCDLHEKRRERFQKNYSIDFLKSYNEEYKKTSISAYIVFKLPEHQGNGHTIKQFNEQMDLVKEEFKFLVMDEN